MKSVSSNGRQTCSQCKAPIRIERRQGKQVRFNLDGTRHQHGRVDEKLRRDAERDDRMMADLFAPNPATAPASSPPSSGSELEQY